MVSLGYTGIAYHHAHHEERHTDDGTGKRLILAVTVVVVVVSGLASKAHENKDDGVRDEVGKRMDGVCYHGSRMSKDTGGKFKGKQQYIDDAACYRNAISFFLSIHNS